MHEQPQASSCIAWPSSPSAQRMHLFWEQDNFSFLILLISLFGFSFFFKECLLLLIADDQGMK